MTFAFVNSVYMAASSFRATSGTVSANPKYVSQDREISVTDSRISAAVPPVSKGSRAAIWLAAGAFFIEMLDGSIITTALPAMGQSFGTSAQSVNIGNTSYLVALAVCLSISGWIAERFEARRVFVTAILLFATASLLCGLTSTLGMFTIARALQGAAGAAMVPVGRLIILRTTQKRHLMAAMNAMVWPGLIAPVIGPPLGGLLVTTLSWQWIFFINLPLGVMAACLAHRLLPALPETGRQKPLDWQGFLLVATGLGMGIYGLDMLGIRGEHGGRAGAAIGVACLLLALAVRHLLRHPAPLLDLGLLRIPTFAVVVRGGTLLRLSMGATPFLLPLFFQLALGMSPVAAGVLLLFVFAGNLVLKPVATALLMRFGFRPVMITNGLLMAASVCLFAVTGAQTPFWLMAVLLFLNGAFRAVQFTSLATIQFADVPQQRMNQANTLAFVMLQLALGIGNAIGILTLNFSMMIHGRALTTGDFHIAFVVMGALSLIGLWDTISLSRTAGNELRGSQDSK